MNNNNYILELGTKAKKASELLSNISTKIKNEALLELKKNIIKFSDEILKVNEKDIENANKKLLSSAIIDRLTLNKDRIDSMTKSIDEIIKLEDPVGKVISEWDRPNGLKIQKISVPLGVIGIIYESRPNVTVDASIICIKSGNAVILRGGTDSFFTSNKLQEIINDSFNAVGLPKNVVQMIDSTDRSNVDEMIKLDKFIDVIIPRGGKGLIKAINENSSIPVIKHLDGICHIFVEKDANLEKAKAIILNSKMRRPGICGAVESLLINESLYKQTLEILKPLINAGCEIRGDKLICKLSPEFKLADNNDWSTEYLEKIISVKLVKNVDEAIDHINTYSSGHTESIITEDIEKFNNFYKRINSAIILQNASTQFADGGEFGFGGEIGISTDKLHVRGPVGVEHLTSFKYVVQGNGQVRS